MNQTLATREVFWNITHVWVMYLLFFLAVVIATYGLYRRIARWRRGMPVDRFDRTPERLRMFLRHALAQGRTVREHSSAVFHTLIYTGFIVLTIATTVVFLDYDLGLPLMRGNFYLYFQSFFVDVFGALVVVGVLIAIVRRVVIKPAKLVFTGEATGILLAILLIAVTGFLLEGWRIAVTADPWGSWSPVGYLIARGSDAVMSGDSMRVAHLIAWWTHACLVFGFLAWAPYTKMAHVVFGPLNIYTSALAPIGASLKTIDFEKAETLGVKTLSGFTWKDLADFDACTECGRCTSVCPAHTVGKELSPRDLILDLQAFMHSDADQSAVSIVRAVPAASPAALWACTTCGACVEACPVFIEQMPKIVDMRRYLVMEEADFPETMQEAITSLESRGHPFRGTQASRLDWTDGLNIRTIAEARDAEVLFWVGCGGALIERNQKVVRATAELLELAGVSFAILGREEKCTGDPARRIGNEFLFKMLAEENTERLNSYGVKKIVTSCPHCFNTFRNEYPQFGGNFEVYHHSEFLAALVAQGKLKAQSLSERQVTFHDPCYLGRQNGVFDAPRELVQISTKAPLLEMKQSRSDSFCCGGGGGMSFIEEPKDKRVNQERARQILETGADVVAVGCPFCLTMLEDGVNARKGERDVRVMDISEILLEAVKTSARDT
ncbi:MAG: heterodisulfide reductase-related iron-sulfur binding cluster [Acidobacteriota bacterium]